MSELPAMLREEAIGKRAFSKTRDALLIAADRIEALEGALRFYADDESWKTKGHPQIDWNDKPILHDGGSIARRVLESWEDE